MKAFSVGAMAIKLTEISKFKLELVSGETCVLPIFKIIVYNQKKTRTFSFGKNLRLQRRFKSLTIFITLLK